MISNTKKTNEANAGNLTWANAYQANLIEFIRVLRMYSMYGNNMKFIILRLPNITATGYLYNSTIQDAQDYVAANVANVELITLPAFSTLDGQHYDVVTIDTIAKMMNAKLKLRDI